MMENMDSGESVAATIDRHGLARILHKSADAISADLSRNPTRLPPRIRIPGQRTTLWLVSDVLAWLRAQQQEQEQVGKRRRPGRPTKLDQARRAGTGRAA